MNALSRFVIKRRWWVIAAWIAAIVLIQVLSASVGGAKYKDDFTLPGTESQTVANLLTAANLSQQNNPRGTLVLHATSGTLDQEPEHFIDRAAAAVCDDNTAHIAAITHRGVGVLRGTHCGVEYCAPRPAERRQDGRDRRGRLRHATA